MHQSFRTGRRVAIVAAFTLLTVSVFAAGGSEEVASEGTFEGDWSIQGSARSIEVDAKEVALFRIEGPAKVRSNGGLATEFRTLCVGVSDKQTGGVGRCVWTDEADEKIFKEISGEIVGPMGTFREAEGAVIGGTGRYQGIEGGFQMDWLFVQSRVDDSKFKGHVIKFEGDWRRPAPSPPPE